MVSLERIVHKHAREFLGASYDMYDITHTHTICGVVSPERVAAAILRYLNKVAEKFIGRPQSHSYM